LMLCARSKPLPVLRLNFGTRERHTQKAIFNEAGRHLDSPAADWFCLDGFTSKLHRGRDGRIQFAKAPGWASRILRNSSHFGVPTLIRCRQTKSTLSSTRNRRNGTPFWRRSKQALRSELLKRHARQWRPDPVCRLYSEETERWTTAALTD